MSKASISIDAIPDEAARTVSQLGLRLRAHRMERGWTVGDAAERLLCSPTTLRALESGKLGTGIGLLAHALWLYGRIDDLDDVAPVPTTLVVGKRVRRSGRTGAAGTLSDQDRDF